MLSSDDGGGAVTAAYAPDLGRGVDGRDLTELSSCSSNSLPRGRGVFMLSDISQDLFSNNDAGHLVPVFSDTHEPEIRFGWPVQYSRKTL
jgi:hypothetical protein